MYTSTTDSVTVTVRPVYLEDQSSPHEHHYVWAYRVRIENKGDCKIQLRTRYWSITDARGKVLEVRGEGVVGEQPVLKPGCGLRIYQRHAIGDAVGHHVRIL